MPVVSARVEVLEGLTAGSFAITNGVGSYTLPTIHGLSNVFHLRASKEGYEPTTTAVGAIDGDSTVDLDLVPLPFAVFGTVTESAPTETKMIPGARVEVVSGSGAGTSVTTSQDGSFRLAETSGQIDVSVSRSGYITSTFHVMRTGPETRLDGRLLPSPRTITESFLYSYTDLQEPRSFFRPIHSDGLLVVDRLLIMYGYPLPNPDMMLQVWRGSDLIGQTRVTPQTPGGGLTVEVAGGALYEIRLSGTRWYRIRIASPN